MGGAPAAEPPPPPPPPGRCHFWLPNKRRHCANSPLPSSQYCGNHLVFSGAGGRRVPCPIDPSHSVLESNLEAHAKRCPLKKQAAALETKPYYSKGINSDAAVADVSSAAKRAAIYALAADEFLSLIDKIRSTHKAAVAALRDSYLVPEACAKWTSGQLDRRLPYQEKHVVQQASILGNMEAFGILQSDGLSGMRGNADSVIEFGAGRGYLTQMLADCYGIMKVFLVERRSYKLKADRSLRQNKSVTLERLRIDIEDLNLNGVGALSGVHYLAIGKHLCGPATDMTIRCCFHEQSSQTKEKGFYGCCLQGLALATCCHHLCQWKHYANKMFFSNLGITEKEFHAIAWFSSWAVDGDHSSKDSSFGDEEMPLEVWEREESDLETVGIERIIHGMPAAERSVLGFMCKEIIDTGRLLWLREKGFDADLVYYVPSNISPENHLLIAKCAS